MARGFAILSIVLVVALVAAGVFGVLARIAQAQAEQNARVALSHQYAGESTAALNNHRPDLALLLAVEAAQLDKNTDTRDALVNALAMMSPYGPAEKQALLEAPDLKTRAEILVAMTEIELAKASTEGETPLQ